MIKTRRGRPPATESLKKALLASTAECLELEKKVKALEAQIQDTKELKEKNLILKNQIQRTEGACAWLEYKLDKIYATR
jgi:hypothetical protein